MVSEGSEMAGNALNLIAIAEADLVAILLDLVMYEGVSEELASMSLTLMLRLSQMHSDVEGALARLQLVASDEFVEMHRDLSQIMKQMTKHVEMIEVWMASDDRDEQVDALRGCFERLILILKPKAGRISYQRQVMVRHLWIHAVIIQFIREGSHILLKLSGLDQHDIAPVQEIFQLAFAVLQLFCEDNSEHQTLSLTLSLTLTLIGGQF